MNTIQTTNAQSDNCLRLDVPLPEAKWDNPLLGRAKGSRLTVERFLTMKHEERALESGIDAMRQARADKA